MNLHHVQDGGNRILFVIVLVVVIHHGIITPLLIGCKGNPRGFPCVTKRGQFLLTASIICGETVLP